MRVAFSKAEIESEIANRFGPVFKLHEKQPAGLISTGISEVDSLIGGLPRGAITEIFGQPSSGHTSFMLSALAQAAMQEEVCALIDTNDVFDPVSAAEARLDLARLLWIRCAGKMEHAFKATDLLLQGGGFGLVILDIGEVPPRAAQRIISSWWYRFRRIVENTPTAFLVVAQESCVRSCASLTLEMKREMDVWASISRAAVSDSQLTTPPNSSVLNFRSRVPSHRLTQNPTYSNLLSGLQLQLERHKPVPLGERAAQFTALAPHY